MNFLSKEQQEELKAKHKLERDRRICDRIKAVLLFDKGWSFAEIAEVLLLSEGAIKGHIDAYKSSKKLIPSGGGSSEKLSMSESRVLESHLEKHCYLYVKDILLYVHSRWRVRYTIAGMAAWLKRHGFSYKKPSVVPGKCSEEKQKEWIEEYDTLKKTLSDDETICFMDGTHPTYNVEPGYGWMKKGKRKEIPSNSGRQRLNLAGIIDILSYRVFVKEETTLNAENTIEFFKAKKQPTLPRRRSMFFVITQATKKIKGSVHRTV